MKGAALTLGATAAVIPGMPQWYIVIAAISVGWLAITTVRSAG